MGFLNQAAECFAAHFIAEVYVWMIQQFYVFGSGILGRVTTLSACKAVVGCKMQNWSLNNKQGCLPENN